MRNIILKIRIFVSEKFGHHLARYKLESILSCVNQNDVDTSNFPRFLDNLLHIYKFELLQRTTRHIAGTKNIIKDYHLKKICGLYLLNASLSLIFLSM